MLVQGLKSCIHNSKVTILIYPYQPIDIAGLIDNQIDSSIIGVKNGHN
jgi:hypothetical protein